MQWIRAGCIHVIVRRTVSYTVARKYVKRYDKIIYGIGI